MKNICKTAIAATSLLWCSISFGQVTIFENDAEAWYIAAGETTTIDFESVDLGSNSSTEFGTDEFNEFFGTPTFTSEGGTYAANTSHFGGALTPSSGTQYYLPALSPSTGNGITGVVRLTFDQPMVAVSSWFLDVGNGFASTGFDIDLDGVIDVAFSESLNDTNGFLGFTLGEGEGITAVDIFLNAAATEGVTNGIADGIAADDVSYAPAAEVIPEPSTYLLMGLGGIFMIAWTFKRGRQS